MAARRLLALAVAALLVVGALLVRSVLGRDDDRSNEESRRVLVCAAELAALCAAPVRGIDEVVVEPAGDTLDRWTTGEAPPVGTIWLTFDPLPDLVAPRDVARSEAQTAPVGSARLAIALPAEHRDVLEAYCGDQAWWRCIGAAAGRPWSQLGGDASWGTVRPAVGDARRHALALFALAHATAGYLGSTEFRRADWEADPAFLPWLRRLVTAVPLSVLSGGTPYATLLTRPSALDLAATDDAEVNRRRPPGHLVIAYPEPLMHVQVVVSTVGGSAPSGVVEELRDRALDAGWSPSEDGTKEGPSAGTLLALRQLWIEAT